MSHFKMSRWERFRNAVVFDRYGSFRLSLVLLVGASAAAVLFLGIGALIAHFMGGYEQRSCSRFGDQTGREVKFVRYSFWSWDCFVRTDDGKWVLK